MKEVSIPNLVWSVFVGPVPEGMRATQRQPGDDFSPENLELVSRYGWPDSAIRRGPRAPRRAKGTNPGPVVGGSFPYAHPLWSAADKVVGRGLPYELRHDLIQDLVVKLLTGEISEADLPKASKAAYTAHNRMTGRWLERSLDAPVPGTDNLRLIDLVDSEAVHL